MKGRGRGERRKQEQQRQQQSMPPRPRTRSGYFNIGWGGGWGGGGDFRTIATRAPAADEGDDDNQDEIFGDEEGATATSMKTNQTTSLSRLSSTTHHDGDKDNENERMLSSLRLEVARLRKQSRTRLGIIILLIVVIDPILLWTTSRVTTFLVLRRQKKIQQQQQQQQQQEEDDKRSASSSAAKRSQSPHHPTPMQTPSPLPPPSLPWTTTPTYDDDYAGDHHTRGSPSPSLVPSSTPAPTMTDEEWNRYKEWKAIIETKSSPSCPIFTQTTTTEQRSRPSSTAEWALHWMAVSDSYSITAFSSSSSSSSQANNDRLAQRFAVVTFLLGMADDYHFRPQVIYDSNNNIVEVNDPPVLDKQQEEMKPRQFLAPTDECGWEGFSCDFDGNGTLIKIKFQGDMRYNTKRPIRYMGCEWGLLAPSLRSLELGGWHVEETMPSHLGLLTRLSKISIWSMLVDDDVDEDEENTSPVRLPHPRRQIPSELGMLGTSLAELTLENNRLRGTIPTELARLTQLVYLALSQNDLEGYETADGRLAPPEDFYLLRGMSNLVQLNLEASGMNGTLSHLLGNDDGTSVDSCCPKLQDLDLSRNRFSGTLPSADVLTEQFQSLTSLDLSLNPDLRGTIPEALCSSFMDDFGDSHRPSFLVDCPNIKCSCCTNTARTKCSLP